MDQEPLQILARIGLALLVGSAIGLERSHHGRPAGFRTHALVCLASALLMQLTVEQSRWFPGSDTVRLDPTRMAQGIMTGIGFLGAGVIFKEGLSVRGLTTAASIWITAALGILAGGGLFFVAIVGGVLTLGVLSAFRWIEARLPADHYAHHRIRFDRTAVMSEPEVRALLAAHACRVSAISYRTTDDGSSFEYRMTIKTRDPRAFERLAAALATEPSVREFHLSPSGD